VLGPQLPSVASLVQGVVQRLDTLVITFAGAVTGLAGLALELLLVLIALLVRAKSGGILGIFFAMPVTVVLAAILQEVRSVPETPDAEPRAEETSLPAQTTAYFKQQNTDDPERK
jgi:hypothetical protein